MQLDVRMELRRLNVGCFGGGTGLPSLLGGLKTQPVAARSTPSSRCSTAAAARASCATSWACCRPATCCKCALALARNEREARRVLLSRLPTLEHARLGGHTGGNLLLSMMEQYSGDFLAAVDGLRALLGCAAASGRSASSRRALCASTATARTTRGEVEVDAGQTAGHVIARLWLEPRGRHPSRGRGRRSRSSTRSIIGPGSFYTSLMPIFLVRGAPEALQQVNGPVILVTNLLTEGRGMWHFTAGDAVRRDEPPHRPADRRRPHQHRAAVRRNPGALPRGAQAAARRRRRARDTARS